MSQPRSRRPDLRTARRKQEVARSNLTRGITLALNQRDIHALERGISPGGATLPGVSTLLLSAVHGDLSRVRRAPYIAGSNIIGERRHRCRALEANITIVPGRISLQNEVSGLRVVREALRSVGESDGVPDVVVCRTFIGFVAASELEAVAVALEIREPPTVDSVAPSDRIDDGDLALELPEIEAVVDVVLPVIRGYTSSRIGSGSLPLGSQHV